MIRVEDATTATRLVNNVDLILFDCDGVIWNGNKLIDGAKDVMLMLRSMNKKLIFVSNNSTKSRRDYMKKFKMLGLDFVEETDIFSSAFATAYYIKKHVRPYCLTNLSSITSSSQEQNSHHDINKKVFVIGESGLIDELHAEGIPTVTMADISAKMADSNNELHEFSPHEFDLIKPDPQVNAVVVGADFNLSYRKIAQAHMYLRYNHLVALCPGDGSAPSTTAAEPCHYFATNTDAQYPTGQYLFPGTGCAVNAISTAIGREPDHIFGKPHATMLDCILEELEETQNLHVVRKRCLMVGDRLDTDIAFGQHGGVKTLLVMSGVTDEQTLMNAGNLQPDFVASSIKSFLH
ncbi:hypothetical protein MP228_007702 [Amoeboaphelidium protococcarum]|nr:hypothetical protein MP228_007702 [Amoeboaphelidium protococcarum]